MDDIATIHYRTYCYNKDDGITNNPLLIHNDPKPTHSQMVQQTGYNILLEKQKNKNKPHYNNQNIKQA